MAAIRTCPNCGGEMPGGALEGLCPKCLGKVTFGLDSNGEPVPSVPGSEPSAPLAEPDGTSPTVPAPPVVSEQTGDRIGRYKLLQNLGQGGMGSVWMAEQTEPVRRLVALKVIKPGMDSAEVLARFESERQALALMDHPNIAKILDAGATPNGRPYFVMDLVKGIPLIRFCDEQRLSVRERLELFMQVCQAVQHAHQKGIIHRDLKPSNVLVALYDGKPVPKVIDFGVAKATGQRLTERTLYTQLGMVLGTLEYMSPEQAELNQLDIDTRSDIYSLGVLLYELLTGTTPLTRETLRQAALDEVLKRIREEEPPKPSLRLSTTGERLPTISAQRKLEPEKLTKAVRGELDWIVMRALEKDRNRRYETANGFAVDLQHYLNDEPVLAGPPTARYRVKKFVRKHRRAVAVAAGFAVLLGIAAVVGTGLALWANLERVQAIEAKAEAQAVLRFFEDKVLAAARPKGWEGGLGSDVTIRAAIEAVEPTVSGSFSNQPLVEAYIRDVLGQTYGYLGDRSNFVRQSEQAVAIYRVQLGPEHPETLRSMNNLAEAYRAAGRLSEALSLHEATLKHRKAKFGLEHPDTLYSMNNLAGAYGDAGRLNEALALCQETLKHRKAKLGAEHPDTLTSMNNLALAYKDVGRIEEALPLFQDTVRLRKAALGLEHPDTLHCMNNLAGAYQAAGRIDEALPLYEETIRLQVAKLGSEHPQTLRSMNDLAVACVAAGQIDEALLVNDNY